MEANPQSDGCGGACADSRTGSIETEAAAHACFKARSAAAEQIRALRRRFSLVRAAVHAAKIGLELLRGHVAFRSVGPCVTVFGSARTPPGHEHYEMARALGRQLALLGFAVMTGGGPGIMEAANRGAREGGGPSLGCNIRLPSEQHVNPYVDRYVEFRHFFARKVLLVRTSCAFVVLPGGFGTLDEVFEMATLAQTGKIVDFPLILLGRGFWEPLTTFIHDTMVRHGVLGAGEAPFLRSMDSIDEAAACIVHCATRRFGLELPWTRRRRDEAP